jgi:cytochrome c-type biogenesis protein CcmE
MKRGTMKVLLTLAIAFGGVTFLALQSTGDVEYYVHVDKLFDRADEWTERKVIQVHGYARKVPTKGTIVDQTIRREFELVQEGKSIRVIHEGVVPDTFKDEAETVVKGKLHREPDGTLLLTTVGGEQGIMAKCPSKYDGEKK